MITVIGAFSLIKETNTGRGAAMIIESLRLFYHINCFRCCVCGIALGNGTAGTDVRVRNNNLHCHDCYSNDDGTQPEFFFFFLFTVNSQSLPRSQVQQSVSGRPECFLKRILFDIVLISSPYLSFFFRGPITLIIQQFFTKKKNNNLHHALFVRPVIFNRKIIVYPPSICIPQLFFIYSLLQYLLPVSIVFLTSVV